MQARVTCATERNEVLLSIVTGPDTEFLVVNFKVGRGARMIEISSRLVGALDREGLHITRDQAAAVYALGTLSSRCPHGEVVQECFSFFARKELEESHD